MAIHKDRTAIKVKSERAVAAAVRLPGDQYDPADPFGELRELAAQAGAEIVGEVSQSRDRPEAGTFMGRGKIDELRGLCEMTDATTIVFDHELSPRQIGNIEELTERKVIDRSELILDIFAARATTHEARLQVELAQLEYTYPRLRAMWSHLERIVGAGGIGGVGTRGPGEQQIEIDRRLVQRRKTQLTRELEEIRARKRRAVEKRNNEHFTVGLVGYTNAGKSTLFNTLTAGGAYADDRLFATLSTRTRAWDLGEGLEVMLSDTVGFVRDLPHHLVASFRATLEEATHADLLLIVLDVSDPAAEMHLTTVNRTLDEIFEQVESAEQRLDAKAERDGRDRDSWTPPERVVLLNKCDKLDNNAEVLVWTSRLENAIPLSSLPDAEGRPAIGAEKLENLVRETALGPERERTLIVPLSESRTIHVLERRGEVLSRDYDASHATLRVRIAERVLDELRASGSRYELAEGS